MRQVNSEKLFLSIDKPRRLLSQFKKASLTIVSFVQSPIESEH